MCFFSGRSSWKKAALAEWLQKHNISFPEGALRKELLHLAQVHKEAYRSHRVDKIVAEHGHEVVRLPPYHCHFNPIELVWGLAKGVLQEDERYWWTVWARPTDTTGQPLRISTLSGGNVLTSEGARGLQILIASYAGFPAKGQKVSLQSSVWSSVRFHALTLRQCLVALRMDAQFLTIKKCLVSDFTDFLWKRPFLQNGLQLSDGKIASV